MLPIDDSIASQFDSQALLEDSLHKLDQLTEHLRQSKMTLKIGRQMKQENLKELEKYSESISKPSGKSPQPIHLEEELDIQTNEIFESDPEIKKIRRELHNKKADDLRKQGNTFYQEQHYQVAVVKYTEALELVDDNKVLLLNRAIAFIKLEEYRRAIEDCSKVIELAKKKENGFDQCKENCFKAFLRRGLAQLKIGLLDMALDDSIEALLLFPNDQEAQHLKQQVEFQISEQEEGMQFNSSTQQMQNEKTELDDQSELQQQIEIDQIMRKHRKFLRDQQSSYLKELKRNEPLSYKDVIDKFVSGQHLDLYSVLQVMQSKTDESAAYFYDKKGIETLIQIIKKDDERIHDKQNLLASLPALILQCYQEQNQIYQEQFLLQYNGVEIIIQKIIKLLHKAQDKKISAIYDTIQDYFEALNIMQGDKTRLIIEQSPFLQIQFYPEVFNRIICLYQTEIDLTATLFSFCANLCYDQSTFLLPALYSNRKEITFQIINVFEGLELTGLTSNLFVQINNLLTNLLIEERFRKYFFHSQFNKEFFTQYYKFMKKLLNYSGKDGGDVKLSTVNFLLNLTYQLNSIEIEYLKNQIKIVQIIQEFSLQHDTIINDKLIKLFLRFNTEKNGLHPQCFKKIER